MDDDMKRAAGTRKRRADAERNEALIVAAAVACFSRHPEASMSDIAEAAGVGRVTLYAHFTSREALLEAAVNQVVAQVMVSLGGARIDDGPAPEALGRMIRAVWPELDRILGLRAAAGAPAPAREREHAAPFFTLLARLLTRGQAEGVFRTDLPLDWLVAAFFSLVHAAGEEVSGGRLDPAAAAVVLEATVLGMLAVPWQPTAGS
jgi:TetR/AcrR family transcriptional repressor of mexCD-oprJ operon